MDIVNISDIRANVMRERGLSITRPRRDRKSRLTITTLVTPGNKRSKTPMMMYLETKYCHGGETIWDAIVAGSLNSVVKRFGSEVERTTISKWIDKYKLRGLPECEGCKHYQLACDNGICQVLIGREDWESFHIKRKEILNETA